MKTAFALERQKNVVLDAFLRLVTARTIAGCCLHALTRRFFFLVASYSQMALSGGYVRSVRVYHRVHEVLGVTVL